MQLDAYSESAIPTPLYEAGFRLLEIEDNISICYKQKGNVHIFVHHALDLFPFESLANHMKSLLQKNINGVTTELVYFYCARRADPVFVDLQTYENFTYCCVPLIAIGQLGLHLDVNLLPLLSLPSRNYCFLSNRNTINRTKIFNFLQQENLVNLGYVSYNNKQDNGTYRRGTLKSGKSFKNFKDLHYTNDLQDNPRQYVWYFPVEDFLFDFHAETFVGTPWPTEKAYKGFLHGKIVVSLGQQGMMHYIESLGFDIYRDIVDYTYDLQHDEENRLALYFKEIKRLALLDFLPDVRDRGYRNRQHFADMLVRCNQILSAIDQDIDIELIRGF